MQVDVALSNAMGLGGHNGCVLLGRADVRLTLVRHATLLMELGGGRILVDPMLGAAGTAPAIEDTPNQRPNPLVELPFPADEVVRGVDGCIVTHLHEDHLDEAAVALLPDELPILTQPESLAELAGHGFGAVTDVAEGWLGLDVTRTGGHHGTGEIGEAMGAVSGFVVDGRLRRRRHDLVRRGARRRSSGTGRAWSS